MGASPFGFSGNGSYNFSEVFGRMTAKQKRRRLERLTMESKNRYSENPPDFARLASLYPSFKPFVLYARDGRPKIDWTNFNSTRELTRILLLHDHGLKWWIPDGQLCPTVPNRLNYIKWVGQLLSSGIVPRGQNLGDKARGFDIGTGANCIYPLLGASLFRWSFVGSDAADVAIEWALRNVRENPHVSELIEIRKVPRDAGSKTHENRPALPEGTYRGPPILLGVVRDGEKFDFCMCNPPFFDSMKDAGLNPRTSCGGTKEEMVCPGGEKAFITRLIQDSFELKESFHWYTSMVGKKASLKCLTSVLWHAGATVVKTSEFSQGKTSRWGLAWSFITPAATKLTAVLHAGNEASLSFMLEAMQRQFTAIDVLKSIESFFLSRAASCTSNSSSFTIDISISHDQWDAILKNEEAYFDEALKEEKRERNFDPSNTLCFCISVFQQIPGALLVKGSVGGPHRSSSVSGIFASIFRKLESILRCKFCKASRV